MYRRIGGNELHIIQVMQTYVAAQLDYVAQAHGVSGAVTVGWSLLVLWVVTVMLSRAVPGAWAGLVLSLTVWFVLDSVASIVRGFPANIVLNMVLYAAFLPGLIGTRPVAAR